MTHPGPSATGQPAHAAAAPPPAAAAAAPAVTGLDLVMGLDELQDLLARLAMLQRLEATEQRRLWRAAGIREVILAWQYTGELAAALREELTAVADQLQAHCRAVARRLDGPATPWPAEPDTPAG
ncbi:hypothetical protein E0493_22270 [Roseomonas sp. M0104]|uniref:Uncharacterized protein n=1 Tax=Teichococcus coralli TaxID=2545983 RepID=A0A845BJ41_9PROT|nr:hypothetical protein [Pseudoroseomonas coralli]MXP66074.1 hypothetical protein [Pseudoroseomonas coralli]